METPESVGIAHNVHILSPSAGTTADAFVGTEREAFLRLLTTEAPAFEPTICDYCRVIDEVPAVVKYGDNLYCAEHAYSELVLDLGRHGQLALPALAFSGADRR